MYGICEADQLMLLVIPRTASKIQMHKENMHKENIQIKRKDTNLKILEYIAQPNVSAGQMCWVS